MQNVAWPIMIVHRLKGIPWVLMPVRNAIPVTIPGSAIGKHQDERDRLAAEEPVAMHRERCGTAEPEGDAPS